MAKRKDTAKDVEKVDNEGDDSSSDNEEIVNVDFDFFDFKPDIDFQAIKNLLRQTFDSDSTMFDLSALADLILSQSSLGSTIKCDGPESDPFAYLTVVNANVHRDHPALRQIIDYIISKSKKNEGTNLKLKELLADDAKTNTAILFSERLINMPTEVVPPMYNMLLDEMKKAVDNGEKYDFDYYIIVSKSFTEIESKIDEEDDRPKKKKKKAAQTSKEIFYFHAEDELFTKNAEQSMVYQFSNEAQEADSKRAFQDYGIAPQGQLMVIAKDKFASTVSEMLQMFAIPGQ
ncbi:p21-C-terminal region-binding protein-domain-containing protein [Myxozyma melibiosi]|uniref:Protein BCP1 n=1 Tax=Myxozyma melibiosi TaxID=54550 RepID=A0ABR1FBP3_9ASCO